MKSLNTPSASNIHNLCFCISFCHKHKKHMSVSWERKWEQTLCVRPCPRKQDEQRALNRSTELLTWIQTPSHLSRLNPQKETHFPNLTLQVNWDISFTNSLPTHPWCLPASAVPSHTHNPPSAGASASLPSA